MFSNNENTTSSNNYWKLEQFYINDYIDLSSQVQFKFIAEDISYDGDNGSGGSLVEAAIDDFKLEFLSGGFNIIGDINGDLEVNVLDIVILINMILGTEPENYLTADLNSDGQINVQDIILVVNIIINS